MYAHFTLSIRPYGLPTVNFLFRFILFFSRHLRALLSGVRGLFVWLFVCGVVLVVCCCVCDLFLLLQARAKQP